MDPEEFEEKLRKLKQEFSCLPPVLVKRIICGDEVKGDLEIASQRLQEFQDKENTEDLFKEALMTPRRPAVEKSTVTEGDFQAPSGGLNVEKSRQPQGGLGNLKGRGNPPKIKPKPGRGPRGGFVHVHKEYQADDFHKREQPSCERPGSSSNRERGRGETRRTQSLSSVEVDGRPKRRENEEDEFRFEQNKLVVRGLSGSTTDEGLLNFIEAKSGEEVKKVTMLGKGKALVTMVERITSKYLRSPKGV